MAFLREIFIVLIAVAAWKYYDNNLSKAHQMPQVKGYFHPAFQKVADTFRKNLETGLERGGAFAVYQNGEALVDIWGGWADSEAERPWQEDTMAVSYSMVKGVIAMIIARLVDMGVLDYKKEVYHYWPEFATNDKKNVTVEMLFSHQAGLLGLDEPVSLYDIRDRWDSVEKQLATQKPFWPPGSACGYHGLTFGMYADALLRRVDPKHRNISQFLQDEIANPLDIEFYIGLPKELYHRYARGMEASLWEFRFLPSIWISFLTDSYYKIMLNTWPYAFHQFNNPDLLEIGHPSALGFGPARSLARLYDYIAHDGSIKGKHLLSPKAVKALREPLTQNLTNLYSLIRPVTRGLFVLPHQGHEIVGHPGFGGSSAFADITLGVGLTYSTNHWGAYVADDPREMSLVNAFYECFNEYKAQKTA